MVVLDFTGIRVTPFYLFGAADVRDLAQLHAQEGGGKERSRCFFIGGRLFRH